jgi:hypothetical protein
MIKITSTYFFSLTCRNTNLKQTVHWGALENAWILWHFRKKRIDIPSTVKDVVRLGCEMTQELRMKERNSLGVPGQKAIRM